MHILQLYKDYPPVKGGIEGHVQLLSEGLVARGHRVTVLYVAPDRRGFHTWRNGVELIGVPRLVTLARTPLSPALLWYAARLRPDVIHAHHPYPFGDLALLVTRAPFVITYHSDIVRQRMLGRLTAPLINHTLHRAACVIAASPQLAATSPWLRRHRERIQIIPFGLPPLPLPNPTLVAALHRRFPGPNALFVGRLRYYKGVEYLIQAIARLPRGHAIIAGGDATVRGYDLVRLAAALGVEYRVHVLGEVDQMTLRALYALADVFVLPSVARSEAFGIVQIEAQLAGLPVICTELGTGTSFVTQHGRTGLVVPPADPSALAQALASLFNNPNRARALGLAGRERAMTEFRLSQMVERIEQVYREVVDS
ncbi:glycosyltransferase [Chloroflexus sp.]|uniref:glycosyltransferase n=1 Tax=Chloroflexus sp. TaxID=1904827 RepID=UPI003C71E301